LTALRSLNDIFTFNPGERRKTMLTYLVPVLYLVVCLLVAYFGRNTRVGYWGTFLLSLALTPFITIIAIIVLGPSKRHYEA